MKRTPIQRKTKLDARGSLKRTRIKRKKAKNADAVQAFSKAVLAGDPLCARCKATRATEAHHACSRARGSGHERLQDPRNGIPLCFKCHQYVHTHPTSEFIKSRDYLDSL